MATKMIIGSIDIELASGNTIGNSAGVTTPRVLAKIDISAATTPKATGIITGGILPLIQDARASMVPALIATVISMPTPQIMISVAQGTEAIALTFRTDSLGNIHTLATGLEHEITPGKSQISGQPWPFGAGRLLHHLHQNLLARFKQFGNACSTFLQAQRTEISYMDEAVLFALSDIDERCINPRKHIFNCAEVNITDLIAALGHDQLVHTIIGQNRCDAQLFSDDNLLGHKQN